MNRRSNRLVLAGILALAAGLPAAGCHTPLIRTQSGSFEESEQYRETVSRDGVGKQIALYLPNRIVDAFDMIAVGVSLGIPLGFDVRVTKWVQLALMVDVGVGVGYDDRAHRPAWASAGTTVGFGPWRAGAGAGSVPSIGDWEVGVGFGAGKVAVDLAEILDFVLGWFFIDLLEDDYGWS